MSALKSTLTWLVLDSIRQLTLQMTPSQSKMNTSTSLSISSMGLDSLRTLAICRDVAEAAYDRRGATLVAADAATAADERIEAAAAR